MMRGVRGEVSAAGGVVVLALALAALSAGCHGAVKVSGAGGTGGGGGKDGGLAGGGAAGQAGAGGCPSNPDLCDMLDCECPCGAGTPGGLVCNDPQHPSFCAGVLPVAGGACEQELTKCGFTATDILGLPCN
jgi:hypothetical protein